MMVIKAKLEMSCSSTTFIKEVFAMDKRIRSYMGFKWRDQSSIMATEPALARSIVANWPQAVAAVWRSYTGIGLAGQVRAGT